MTLDNTFEDLDINYECQYYTINEFYEQIENKSELFSLISYNIRSLKNKSTDFPELIKSISGKAFIPSIICLQEVWGGGDAVTLDGYHPFAFRERGNGRRGGGVGAFVKNNLRFEIIQELSKIGNLYESIFIKVFSKNDKYRIIGNFYRIPGTNLSDFNNEIENILSLLHSSLNYKNAEEILICGDFNIDLMKHLSHAQSGNFLSIMLASSFLPVISIPTRVNDQNASLIDNIFTNKRHNDFKGGVILSNLSDHMPCIRLSVRAAAKTQLTKSYTRNLSKRNIETFKYSLSQTNWNFITQDLNAESAFNNFELKLKENFDNCFPLMESKNNKRKIPEKPWMTSNLLSLRNKKDKLFKIRIKNPSEENISKFKQISGDFKKKIREAKKSYFDKKFEEFANNTKKTWSLINEIVSKSKNKSSLPSLFHDEYKTFDNMQSIVNGMNDFFTLVGPNLSNEIPDSDVSFDSYLGQPKETNFIFATVTKEIVMKTINYLKPKKSCGEDGISMFLLKQIIESIINPLVHLFNLSFKSGYIPASYKTAKVIPIFKSGNMSQFNNYRPISILPAFSKLLEKIAAQQMMKYLEKYNVLHTHQYGFRKNHNTTFPVLNLLDNIYKSLNDKKPSFSICIFLDLKKAFDSLDINVQTKKLEHYGFRNTANKWFKSYLTGRQQYVFANGYSSTKMNLTHGVPQGSVLGPILFLLYINDLPNVTSFLTYLFADDTSFIKSSKNLNDLMYECNLELEKAKIWFRANKLTLNISKTKYMIFRNPKAEFNEESFKLRVGNEDIERVKSFKFVGVIIDEFLTFEEHTSHITQKVSSSIYALRQVKNVVPSKTLKTLYNTLVKPHIEYGLSIWGGRDSKYMSKLTKVQKNAVRTVAKSRYNAHTTPLFGNLGILKINDMYIMKVLELVSKWRNNKLPLSMNAILTPLQSTRSCNLKNELPLSKMLKNLPIVKFPQVWNNQSYEIRSAENCRKMMKKVQLDFNNVYKSYACTKRNCYPCGKA